VTAPWRCGCVLPRGPFCGDHRREFFGDEPPTDADRFLILIRDNPTLLPAAVVATGQAMERRRLDEVHACLRCGARAQCAIVAGTKLGERWLDLCMPCTSWLRLGATPHYDERWRP
jgi:hypothetical protein